MTRIASKTYFRASPRATFRANFPMTTASSASKSTWEGATVGEPDRAEAAGPSGRHGVSEPAQDEMKKYPNVAVNRQPTDWLRISFCSCPANNSSGLIPKVLRVFLRHDRQLFVDIGRLLYDILARSFSYMMERKRSSPSIGIVAMSLEAMTPLYVECDNDTIVSTARVIADRLAEESGKLSLVAYYDNPERGDLIQFRVRRPGSWKKYDVRSILPLFSIKNGGGHEGAIAFRVPRDSVSDFDAYIRMLVDGIEAAIPK